MFLFLFELVVKKVILKLFLCQNIYCSVLTNSLRPRGPKAVTTISLNADLSVALSVHVL